MSDVTTGVDNHRRLALDRRLAALSPGQRALVEQQLKSGLHTGHGIVAATLSRLGVTHVYGVPGQPVYDTFAACAQAGLRLIGTRHQHPAALMAAAHNYIAGAQPAVTILSTGAPAANAISAANVAMNNCWPLVLLSGSMPQSATDVGYFMSLDAVELFRPVTKWATRVLEPAQIPSSLAKALSVAIKGRPGPVLVELPEDVLTGLAPASDRPPAAECCRSSAELDPAALQQVAAALIAARRPLLIAGSGLRWASCFAELRELVDDLAVPCITSANARGALPDGHPLCMNAVQWKAQAQADVVLLLGARLNWAFRYGQQLAAGATVIQVDVDGPELARSGKVTLGVHAEAGQFVRALLQEVGPARRVEAQTQRDQNWIDGLNQLRIQTEARREVLAVSGSSPISPLRLAAEVRDALPDDAISIFDGNLTMAACQRMIPAQLPVSRLTPGTSGCMGVGIPFAIAAKIAHPRRPVVAICGDFAFGLSAMELETAARHNIPIVIVVANNDGNGGSLRHRMHMISASESVTMFQKGLRYDVIAGALGCHAEHVEHASGIGPALSQAIASNRPACINVAIDPDAPFPAD